MTRVPAPHAPACARMTRAPAPHAPACARMTRAPAPHAPACARRFQRVLDVSGISASLRAAGIKEGDGVALGDVGEFVWSEERGEAAVYEAWLEDMKSRGRNRQGKTAWPGAKRG
jgi:hypothetical protein